MGGASESIASGGQTDAGLVDVTNRPTLSHHTDGCAQPESPVVQVPSGDYRQVLRIRTECCPHSARSSTRHGPGRLAERRVSTSAAAFAGGWRPTPFRGRRPQGPPALQPRVRLLLRLHDGRPELAGPAARDAAETSGGGRAAGSAEHAARTRPGRVRVILHGGEPLLVGADRLGRAGRPTSARRCPTTARLRVSDADQRRAASTRRCSACCASTGSRIGVSLDGTAADHDRHRRYPRRAGAATPRSTGRCDCCASRSTARRYAGLLCTVDPDTDPVACYEALLAFEPPAIDFLLPHANWSEPPRPADGAGHPVRATGWSRSSTAGTARPPGDPGPALRGHHRACCSAAAAAREQVGLSPVGVVVVETDGAIEQVDSLKSAYPGACAHRSGRRARPFDAR